MSIKNVEIRPGCISCGLCAFVAPEIFEITDISHIKKDADFSQHETALKEAAKSCPVQVIFYEEEHDITKER